jgi:ribosomal-protein-alanine N-acetyltransferase
MRSEKIDIRCLTEAEIPSIVSYFVDATDEHLLRMGVDRVKLFKREEWIKSISIELQKPLEEKQLFYVIWEVDGKPIGHSNINKIKYTDEAYMHLHMWTPVTRQRGLGTELVKRSIPFYFNNFKLKNLFCEPYAHNPAPNKTLPKLGFEFIKKYNTIPGVICFPQEVNRYVLTRDKFEMTW